MQLSPPISLYPQQKLQQATSTFPPGCVLRIPKRSDMPNAPRYLGSEDVKPFLNLLTRLDKADPTGIPLVNDIDLTIVIVAEDVEIVIY
eukprot:CAMPEP_0178494122 /NCGR_PEP_ID=MMETSP0696-20121128/12847_1 /TAXON_ID=265572 /ORGANISM="Extubocellulus spinifer, Strain CCMP396" /LENGTH=88 /DNA_ID=CAMNT_0020122181 /DNA_START=149 /DNA_END=412 /DNA_ORIENTATION=+